jgi:hypothetical protein
MTQARARCPTRRSRLAGSTGAAVAATVVLVLLLSNLSADAVGMGSPGLAFPGSRGYGLSLHSPRASEPCGSAAVLTAAKWNSRTGRATWAGVASARTARGCMAPKYCGMNSSCVYLGLDVSIPLRTPAVSGLYQISANWSLRGTFQWVVSKAHCPAVRQRAGSGAQSCDLDLVESFWSPGTFTLTDLTTGSTVVPNRTSGTIPGLMVQVERDLRVSCSSSICARHNVRLGQLAGLRTLSANGTLDANGTWLSSSHTYAASFRFFTEIETSSAWMGRPWSSYAEGSVEFAGPHDGFQLTGLAVT